MDQTTTELRRDVRIIGTVGMAHFFSHFFQLVLPPLFPVLKATYGVSYTELGLMMTAFFAASGLSQTPAGFLVDRIGAHRVLAGGLTLLSGGIVAVALAPSFWTMLPLLILAGIGNSVFHPSDYAILTHKVTPRRLARSYSIHTLCGTIGWSAAPVAMLGLSALWSWRAALVIAGLAGLTMAGVVIANRGLLRFTSDRGTAPHTARTAPAAPQVTPAALLANGPIVLCFAYFALVSVSLCGLQTFLPATLPQIQGIDVATASVALTTYLVASAGGTLLGGILADRTTRHERIIAAGLAGAALLLLTVGYVALTTGPLFLAIGMVGIMSGTTTPSRDMLVRSAAPSGATGKVFGFVYSGLDLGAATAPLVLGLLLDNGHPALVMTAMAVTLGMTITTALLVKRQTRKAAARKAAQQEAAATA